MREFPGGLVVRILGFHCCGLGSIPSWETEIPQAMQLGQKKKKNENKKTYTNILKTFLYNQTEIGSIKHL